MKLKPTGFGAQFVTGTSAAIVLYVAWSIAWQAWLSMVPVNQIFVAEVRVPDFMVGENPIVDYPITVRQEFIDAYRVEVKSEADRVTRCSGGASGIRYEPAEPRDLEAMTFDWYVGAPCSQSPGLIPGRYFLETTYTISIDNWPTKYLTTVSNVFEVRPPKAPGLEPDPNPQRSVRIDDPTAPLAIAN